MNEIRHSFPRIIKLRILDVGCGMGFLRFFWQGGHPVTGDLTRI
ncbi:MAG: hypothetical protein ACLVB1_02335 [Blautia obeum]